MKAAELRKTTITFTAGALTALCFAVPLSAHAGIFDIFSILNSTISNKMGGPLTSMNSIASSLQKDEQTVLFPLKVINQTHTFVSTIIGSYRSWMSTVFTMQVGSAQLSSNQLLEAQQLGGLSGTIGTINGTITKINGMYNSAFGALPSATAAPTAHRQMMDMDDALAKDGLSQSVAGDTASASFVTMANGIESQSVSAAPGTASMLSASARTAELSSLANQHKLLAAMLREEAGGLAHDASMQKQAVMQAQQMNSNMSIGAVTKTP